MSQVFVVHPDNPQPRLIKQAVNIIEKGGIIVYPTDSAYALGCRLGDKDAMQKIKQIRQLDDNHHFTLVCRNLSEISSYAVINNSVFRLLKAHTPGPFTFILNATKEVPRRLMHPKRHTIGLRVPDNAIVQALLEELQEPLMSVTLILPELGFLFADVEQIEGLLKKRVDVIIDGGVCGSDPTTVVDLTEEIPQILRQGKGVIAL